MPARPTHIPATVAHCSLNIDYFRTASYYIAELSLCLSVEPLADKYLSLSPYAYCAGNLIELVDPDGKEIDEWEFNIVTRKCTWISNKGGKMVDYVNVHDGSGNDLGTAVLFNNAHNQTFDWNAQDLGDTKYRSLHMSDGVNYYNFLHINNDVADKGIYLPKELPNPTYEQKYHKVSDTSAVSALGSLMWGEAAHQSGNSKFPMMIRVGQKWVGVADGLVSLGASIDYAYHNRRNGNYARVIVQGVCAELNFCGPWGTAASFGLSARDYYYGEIFYNWIDEQ